MSYKLEVLEDLRAVRDEAMNTLNELKMNIDDIDVAVDDLEREVVDIELYQALKDDVADLIVALKTHNDTAFEQCLQFVYEYYTPDERKNIMDTIMRTIERRITWD